MRTCAIALLASLGLGSGAAAQTSGSSPNECVRCHEGLPEARLSAPAAAVKDDVHVRSGFTCVDCHGGNAAEGDAQRAKAPATGFRGVPRGAAQIATCARCHSDAELMRRFSPRQRIDQAAEYAVSGHGKRLAAGNATVATCASCHGAHGVRFASDPKSPVHPTAVAATCGTCHTQRSDYEKSVHFHALTKRGDLSAPTCNDCHGNHGAAPPGVDAVANVCGTCHAVFASKFAASTHAQIFTCVECHGNHAVSPSSDEMLGATAPGICTPCHGGADDLGFATAGTMRSQIERLKASIAHGEGLVERLRLSGMSVRDQDVALDEARNRLVQARMEVHAFSPSSQVEPVTSEGLQILSGVERAAQRLLVELRFRRRGLIASVALILIVVGALALKIRRLERRGDV